MNFSEAQLVIKELALFHAVGFLLKRYVKTPRGSNRYRGNENWRVFIQKDCWCRNLMLSNNNRVKFIDFGFFLYDHCLKDLTYFLFTSTRTSRVYELCNSYKLYLEENLQKLNITLDIENFSQELNKITHSVYPLAIKIIRIVRKRKDKQNQLIHAENTLRELTWRLKE